MLMNVLEARIGSGRILVFLLLISLQLASCGGPSYQASGKSKVAYKAADIARSMVGRRYKFGGNNPGMGFDCSGLVEYSYSKAGIKVPRSTRLQRRQSRAVSIKNMQKGDLIFFNQLGKGSSHVGIYLGNREFVHAPSSGKTVRIDKISSYWEKHISTARRFY